MCLQGLRQHVGRPGVAEAETSGIEMEAEDHIEINVSPNRTFVIERAIEMEEINEVTLDPRPLDELNEAFR